MYLFILIFVIGTEWLNVVLLILRCEIIDF